MPKEILRLQFFYLRFSLYFSALAVIHVAQTECNQEIFDGEHKKNHDLDKIEERRLSVVLDKNLMECCSKDKKGAEKAKYIQVADKPENGQIKAAHLLPSSYLASLFDEEYDQPNKQNVKVDVYRDLQRSRDYQ